MVDATPFLPGLSPVQGKAVVARFDGGRLSSEGGLLVLREVERRLGLADRLAACLKDPRAPEKVVHRLAQIIRFRMLMIAAGYEDGNDADTLRRDPMFKLALDRLPSDEELCSQSTISRLENLPDSAGAAAPRPGADRAVLRLVPAGAQAHRARYRRHLRPRARRPATAPVQRLSRRLRLPADCRLRRRGAVRDGACCGPASGRAGRRSAPLCAASSAPSAPMWPKVEILLRADSHYASSASVRLVPRQPGGLGLRPGPQCRAFRRHVAARWRRATAERFKATPDARQEAPLHAILRCRSELEPGRAHHRPCRAAIWMGKTATIRMGIWRRGHRDRSSWCDRAAPPAAS